MADTDAQTMPTSSSGGPIPRITNEWVDRAERWLWKGPRQQLLEDDYKEFLAELKKRLNDL